jgi:2,5-diamino-6-(ribosylamino)-4(3H)-pyrimidinone 5'-phosphate reductase
MAVFVHANCAMSLDGCLGLPGPKPLKLSGPEDLRRVHRLRANSDAILVGIGTALADDPKLTVKWELLDGEREHAPTRIVLDRDLRTPAASQVGSNSAPTLLFHQQGAQGGPPGATKIVVGLDGSGRLRLDEVLEHLARLGMKRLMVEGGSAVLSSFLAQRLIDEFSIYIAPLVVGLPGAPRLFQGQGPLEMGMKLESAQRLGDGVLVRFVR